MADINDQQLDALIEAIKEGTGGCQPAIGAPTSSGLVPANFAEAAVQTILGGDPSNLETLGDLLASTFPDDTASAASASVSDFVGEQAVVATVAQVVSKNVIPRLGNLRPLRCCNDDCRGYETLIPLITNSIAELAAGCTVPGNFYAIDAKTKLENLIGSDGENLGGLFRELEKRLGIGECIPCSREQEQTVTDFAICTTFLDMFTHAMRNNVTRRTTFFGTQLQTIGDLLAHICAQLDHLDGAVSAVEANALLVETDPPITLRAMFASTRELCRRHTVEMLAASGCDGIQYQLDPAVQAQIGLYETALREPKAGDVDCGIGAFMRRRTVQKAFHEILCDLQSIHAIVGSIQTSTGYGSPPPPPPPTPRPRKPQYQK